MELAETEEEQALSYPGRLPFQLEGLGYKFNYQSYQLIVSVPFDSHPTPSRRPETTSHAEMAAANSMYTVGVSIYKFKLIHLLLIRIQLYN